MNIQDYDTAIAEKKAHLERIFAEAGDDMNLARVKCLSGDEAARTRAVRALNDELAELGKQRKEAIGMMKERQAAEAAIGYVERGPIKMDPGDTPGSSACSRNPAVTKKFSGMFPQVKRDNGGFHSFNEYLETVASGRADQRLKTMTVGSSTGGGFMVPTQYAAEIIDAALELEIVRPRATVWPMTSDVLRVPGWDGSNHSSSLFGGFSGVWIAEGATSTRQTPKVRQIELKTKKIAVFTQVSRELYQDGINFDSQLSDTLIKSLAFYMDNAFISGSGVGEPLGIMSDPALVTVSEEDSQDEDSFVYANAVNMLSRLHPACFNNAVWIASPTLIPELLTLAILSVGGTSFVPAVTQAPNGSMTLLTRPILFSEKMQALGDLGDILLCDLSKYAIGMRQDIAIDKSLSPGWTEDTLDFRAIARVDAQGMWDAPITPVHGESLSWCVTLEERAG